MNSSKISAGSASLGVALVACCVVGYPTLYDKFLISRFVLAAIGLSFFFLNALLRNKELLIPRFGAFYIYTAFVVLSGLSVFWSTNTGEAVYALSTRLLAWFSLMVFFNLLSTDYQGTRKILWICCAVILSVYLLFACVQLFGIKDFSFEQLYLVSGINGHKNLMAIMLFLLSAFLLSAIPFLMRKILKITLLLLFVVAVTVVVLLKSRAALLSVVVAAVLFGLVTVVHRRKHCFLRKLKTTVLILSNVFVIVFFTIGLRWLVTRSVPQTSHRSEIEYSLMSTSSLVERCVLWDKTYRVVDKYPLLGCGVGNWQIHFPDVGFEGLYRSDVWNVNFTKPHNEYLGILSEGGYPVFVLYVVFLTSLVVYSFFALCETKDRKEFLFGALVLCAFVGSCVDAMFDFPNSRVEHMIWTGALGAILFHFIVGDKRKPIGKAWSSVFLLFSLLMVVVGCFRFYGERKTFDLQHALRKGDWAAMERCCSQAVSPFYTIDPLGLPLHWYWGKAAKRMGDPRALFYLRTAYHYAPFCRENLNDLGLEEYYTAHNIKNAEFCFKEAIRISPNFLYSYFNLAYIYIDMDDWDKAKAVVDQIYMDEEKRDVLMEDAEFFEPYNAEAIRQKIASDYEAAMRLRQMVSQSPNNEGSVTKPSSSAR